MTTTTEFNNYAEMLTALKELAHRAGGVEGADTIGAFIPVGRLDAFRSSLGDFSNLSEWLDDIGDTIQEFLDSDEGDEVEGWSV